MNSQNLNLIEKYKYFKIQNNLLRKHRIQNKDNNAKMQMNIPIRSNKLQYFPIESDKSKTGGHTIYLVTEESNYINENEKKDLERINLNKNIQNKNNYFPQRSIEFKIEKSKNNLSLNSSKYFKNINNNIKSYIYISENKSYVINSFDEFDKPKKIKNANTNNIRINLSNNIYNINKFKLNEENKNIFKYKYFDINGNNNTINTSKTPMYRKKIQFNKNIEKNEKDENNQKKSKIEIINKFTEIQKNRNISKEENNALKKEEKISKTEIKKRDDNNDENKEKSSLSKENSLQDVLTTTNLGILNRSLDEINYNIDSLYRSLDFVQNKIVEDLNNSKIMEKNFLDGMKNQDRKNSLKKAMARYNRFKSLGKLEKKKNCKLKNSPKYHKNVVEGEQVNNELIEENKKEIIKENKNELKIEEKNEENKISNIDEEENENENEFSFNSELKKFEKKNNLENIIKDNNLIIKNEIELNDFKNINKNINDKIEQDYKKEEKIKEQNENIIERVEIKDILDIEKEKEKEENANIIEKMEVKEILDNEKEKEIIQNEDYKKRFIKQEINSSKDSIDKKQ